MLVVRSVMNFDFDRIHVPRDSLNHYAIRLRGDPVGSEIRFVPTSHNLDLPSRRLKTTLPSPLDRLDNPLSHNRVLDAVSPVGNVVKN